MVWGAAEDSTPSPEFETSMADTASRSGDLAKDQGGPFSIDTTQGAIAAVSRFGRPRGRS
jgi:hypothetical protein